MVADVCRPVKQDMSYRNKLVDLSHHAVLVCSARWQNSCRISLLVAARLGSSSVLAACQAMQMAELANSYNCFQCWFSDVIEWHDIFKNKLSTAGKRSHGRMPCGLIRQAQLKSD